MWLSRCHHPKRLPGAPSRLLPILALVGCLAPLPTTADDSEIDRRRFRLGKGGAERSVVELTNPGILSARVRVRTPLASAPVRLVLTAPDGTTVEKATSAPFTLEHYIGPDHLGSWTVDAINVGKIGELTGEIRVHFEATPTAPATSEPTASSPTASVPESPTSAESQGHPLTPTPPTIPRDHAGTVTPATEGNLRAACQGNNAGVDLVLNLEANTAQLRLGFNPVARYQVTLVADGVYRLDGTDTPLLLDTNTRNLGFQTGPTGHFCRVRLYR